MTIRSEIGLTALLGLVALSGCASTGTGSQNGNSSCQPHAAQALVGKFAPDNHTILRRTGSTTIRRIAPGDAVAEDFREERVTVTVADGRIVAAACG
ncbi:I78 family peptidase inhibitor [Sphingomonas sp. 179-I 2A4 NHS]|uniref:I78 family peptidase inhibitor n=1 Tax=unclassified Sphingomonas TaxID=196159 RepID=UPI00387A3CC9